MSKLVPSEQYVTVPSTDARIRLERDLLKDLARPAPFRLLLQTGIEWFCIVVLIIAATAFPSMLVSVLCMLLIATRQHALLALMHEYSHYQFSRKHVWLNDLIGDIFTAFPFFITIHGFRRGHMTHHRHALTDQDPNWVSSLKKTRYQFPKMRRQIFIEILKHCIGRYSLEDLKGYTVDSGMAINLPCATCIVRVAFAVVLTAAVIYFRLWWTMLLYWIVPLATFLMAILYVRDIGEHFGMPSPGVTNSRTVLAGWLERLLICQNNVNFHVEHHLFPSVPFFRLRSLHHALMKNPHYRSQALITHGYLFGLMNEISISGSEVVSEFGRKTDKPSIARSLCITLPRMPWHRNAADSS